MTLIDGDRKEWGEEQFTKPEMTLDEMKARVIDQMDQTQYLLIF